MPSLRARDSQAADFGWSFPADRKFLAHRREVGNTAVQTWTDDNPTPSVYVHAGHQEEPVTVERGTTVSMPWHTRRLSRPTEFIYR